MFQRSQISRRRFIRRAGAVGTGVALGPHLAIASDPSSQPAAPESAFSFKFDSGAITSLRHANDRFDTDYVRPGSRLGDVIVTCRRSDGAWQGFRTVDLEKTRRDALNADQTEYTTTYRIADGAGELLLLQSIFLVKQDTLLWTIEVQNLTDHALEIGDLALPLPMNTHFEAGKAATASVLKHSFVSGDGSFFYWMRSNSAGPFLTLTPLDGTALEYWDAHGGYRVFLHSAVAGAEARDKGCHWRQPNTSLVMAARGRPLERRSYQFAFQWADDHQAVRRILFDNGLVDVHVVPGMTVPSDLFAAVALRTKRKNLSIEAEFPESTEIQSLGSKGDYQMYQIRFSRLGENRLTVRYGNARRLYLEFFSTEPLETLIAKRAAFIADHQTRDPAKWYNGLLCEWNMDSQVSLSPDNYDRIKGWRIYEVTCDDPGLSKPAFLASKNAEYPVQGEVAALDEYIHHFVWGGLQRTTDETHAYGIYGIPDWKTLRDSKDPGDKGKLHIWRIYDYSHIVVMYFSLYRVAKHHPQIKTALSAAEYLRRAAGTAVALFTVPDDIVKWSAYETGLYNELVIVNVIDALAAEGMAVDAGRLRTHWERKVKFFVNDKPDLFGSEYPFDSTGFESTHALAKYAVGHADAPGAPPTSGIPLANALKFLKTQIDANLFCRGSIEPAYFLLGSDYRAQAGDSYTLSYMSQMGGWAILDYGLNFADDPSSWLRLGYASYLSAWALMNTGTARSSFGYWYPGVANDGAAGGGFEPSPYGVTWLGQPHHRGSWYYASEIDLGYCGALRTAATLLTDDPIFGRFCFGGTWRRAKECIEVFPKDGVRRRFHALLGNLRLHLICDTDRFPRDQPIVLKEDLSEIRFHLESDRPTPHEAQIQIGGLVRGRYAVVSEGQPITTIQMDGVHPSLFTVPLPPGVISQEIAISFSPA